RPERATRRLQGVRQLGALGGDLVEGAVLRGLGEVGRALDQRAQLAQGVRGALDVEVVQERGERGGVDALRRRVQREHRRLREQGRDARLGAGGRRRGQRGRGEDHQ